MASLSKHLFYVSTLIRDAQISTHKKANIRRQFDLVKSLFRLIFGVVLSGLCSTVLSAELTIAVAANFAATLKLLATEYQLITDDTILISIGSSGKLSTQIIHGAPYDIFLSADSEHPQTLIDKQLANVDSRFTYAVGTLALWKPHGGLNIHSRTGFDFSTARLVGLASPRHAPYGKAAQEVLTAMGQWQALSANQRLAFAESVGQAWHYAASGSVDAAFVALSQITAAQLRSDGDKDRNQNPMKNTQGSDYWLPPKEWYTPIVQQGVILRNSKHQAAAERFSRWLQTDAKAIKTIQTAGYNTVGPPTNGTSDAN